MFMHMETRNKTRNFLCHHKLITRENFAKLIRILEAKTFRFLALSIMFTLLGSVNRIHKLFSAGSKNRKRNAFVSSIAEGEKVDSVHRKTLEDMMVKCLMTKGVEEKMRNAKDHSERIEIVKQSFQDRQFEQVLKALARDLGKSVEISKLLVEKAYAMMDLGKDHELILRCFNLAILFAPTVGECLADNYAARSRIFYSEKNSENCLRDVRLALAHGCPEEAKEILLDMESKCLNWIAKKNEQISVDTLRRRYYRDGVLFKLKGEKNEKIPAAINGIRVDFNETKERHIVTDVYLAPGTTVIVEEPFAKTVTNFLTWDTSHCFTCLANVEGGIPCPNCVFVTYCSEECLQKDLKDGHVYECPCLPLFHAMKIPRQVLLAFKILCKVGPANMHKCWLEEKSKNEQDEEQNNLIFGFNPKTGTYDSDSYYQIQRLKSHLEENDLYSVCWYAVAAIKALDYLTPYFQDFNDDEFKSYMGLMFVNHCLALLCNAVALCVEANDSKRDEKSMEYSDRTEVAAAVYSVISLLSHSCDANVMRQNLPNGKMVIITNRELYPGEEITLSYGYSYYLYNFAKRQSEMKENYHFSCTCIPCTLGWPEYHQIQVPSKFLCPNCSLSYKDSLIDQIQNCTLPPPTPDYVTVCWNCQHKVHLQLLIDKANRIKIKMNRAEDLFKNKKSIEAIPVIVNSITKLQSLFRQPSKEFVLAQLWLCKVLEHITDA